MKFDCHIADGVIPCVLTSDRDLASPILCFSGMAPMTATAGGTKIAGCGSYTEVQLPDLAAGVPHDIEIRYEGHTAANRAWLPMGPYLRVAGEVHPLPTGRLGADPFDYGTGPDIDGLRLVPQPRGWTPTGETLQMDHLAVDVAPFATVAALADRRGFAPFLDPAGVPVTVETAELPTDAYQIDIRPDGITVRSGSDGGTLYAAITLLTLRITHAGHLPCGTINDAPRFAWRGQHLDCARHFFQPDTIRDLLDLMALLKLNRFHWHFADDEAFRLQIDSLPALWQQTALRGEGQLMPALFAGEPVSGGSYSKSDAAGIVAHAASLNIAVMPEIEAPAHALALARVVPDLRDPDDTGRETSVQGYRENVVNPAMPATWDTLDRIATEVGALFPFGVLHLGCDELPEDTWLGSPAARALMEKQGLKTTNDLQGWTIARLAATVTGNGQRPAAWEEAARGNQGGIGHDAILFSWTGQGPGIAAARAGHQVVMCPAQHTYLDMAHTSDPDDWGANWAAYVDLPDTVAWDPIPQDAPDIADQVIGVQACFWAEFTTADHQMWPMLMPRLLGVAAKAWQSDDLNPDRLFGLARHYRDVWPVQH